MRTALIGAVLVALSGLGCDKNPAAPSPASSQALTEVTRSAHYTVRTSPGDTVDLAWQEQYFEWVTSALQLGPSPPLEYNKYRDRAHLKAVTGRETNGFAEPGTARFHSIWPVDNHEGVHVLVVLQIGHPPALFNEGVAVAHSTDPARGILTPRWNGSDLHQLAKNYDATGRLPTLPSLLRSTGFFDFDTNITYPCAGSFVRYLIDTYGLASFKALLRGATFDDAPSTSESRFQTAYGRSLASVWEEWRAWLRTQ